MPPRKEYTRLDNAGFIVRKGDRVTIAFEAEVREVLASGMMVVRTPEGVITSYSPDYQGLLKIHDNTDPNTNTSTDTTANTTT